MASKPRYRMGDKVRAVRGPSGTMEADRRHIGRTAYIVGVHLFRGAGEHHYSLIFDNEATPDNADESCLERA